MCRRGDQVSVIKRRGDGLGCNQAADVSHVSEQVRVDVGAELQRERRQKNKCHTHTHNAKAFCLDMKISGTTLIFHQFDRKD